MTGRTILATLDGKDPYDRLEIALVQDQCGRVRIDLREQHYAEKIGWFDQRRLELDPRQFKQLQAVLALNSGQIDEMLADRDTPATIPFPGPAEYEIRRTAVGESI